jgi:hypothetical protein
MPRRGGSSFSISANKLLVLVALVLTVLDILNIPVRGVPLLPAAVLLLCIAWLMP